jgi:hypothetical protein
MIGRYVLLKRRFLQEPHSVTSQNDNILIISELFG